MVLSRRTTIDAAVAAPIAAGVSGSEPAVACDAACTAGAAPATAAAGVRLDGAMVCQAGEPDTCPTNCPSVPPVPGAHLWVVLLKTGTWRFVAGVVLSKFASCSIVTGLTVPLFGPSWMSAASFSAPESAATDAEKDLVNAAGGLALSMPVIVIVYVQLMGVESGSLVGSRLIVNTPVVASVMHFGGGVP